jgi:hypothetical protein
MGCFSSKQNPDNENNDDDAIKNFLNGGSTLDDLWSQFDSNKDGEIDECEFQNLVYTSLKHFCVQRNPNQDPPSKDEMGPFIMKLVTQLQPFVDKDQDKRITKEEFRGYGAYLTNEFNKLQTELKNKPRA